MLVISGYKVEILKLHTPLRRTMEISRRAVSWLVPVIDGEWDALSAIDGEKRRFNAAERLIHSVRGRKAKYGFDTEFPKMPSYLRRAILQHVIGEVSSRHTGQRACPLSSRKKEGRDVRPYYMPVFYKDNMYRKEEDRVFLKLYSGTDWIWQEIRLKKTDLDYLRKNWSDVKAKSPVLVKRHKKYYLQFSYETSVSLTSKKPIQQRVCAVDLGINTDAVCSIMKADGTVAARRFIRFAAEKDHLHHVLNRVRKHQSKHGPQSVRGFWAYASRLNEEIARKTAGAIIQFARENSADVIVFEHLDMQGRKMRGKNRQKLHLWKKQAVQKITEHQAHRLGMRISRICAWKTSAYAYDGSGKVTRDPKNHSLAVFQNGKQYNCDLSASYNLGARYFIRELLKTVPETERSVLEAKVPAVQRRTSCVYADLKKLSDVMAEEKAA